MYTRRVSLEEDFFDKKIDDVLWGLMAGYATYSPKQNLVYLTKKEYEKHRKTFYKVIGSKDRHTLNRHVKKLIDKGLIKEDKVGDYPAYIINQEKKGAGYIIDGTLLEYLCVTCSSGSLWTFVWLADKMDFVNKVKGTERSIEDLWSFSCASIAKAVGYTESTARKAETIKEFKMILTALKKLKFIDYAEYFETIEDTTRGKIVTPKYRLLKVATKIEDILTTEQIQKIWGINFLEEEKAKKAAVQLSSSDEPSPAIPDGEFCF